MHKCMFINPQLWAEKANTAAAFHKHKLFNNYNAVDAFNF